MTLPRSTSTPETHRPAGRSIAARLGIALAVLCSAVLGTLGATATPAAAATCPPAVAAPFTDVPLDHAFCREIAVAKAHNAVSGYPDGSFHPGDLITRQAAVAILYRAANDGATAAPCVVQPFSDVAITDPFCGEIRDAALVGIVKGYPDGSFHPMDPITRQATAAVMTRFPNGAMPLLVCGADPFTDVAQDHPFCNEISFLKSVSVVNGYPDGSFHPAQPVTRQAFVAILVRWAAFLDGP